MPSVLDELTRAIRDAAERAFSAVRDEHPLECFYYFALVTTADALRPGPSASSIEGLARIVHGQGCSAADRRWSEADSPYNLYGDEHFAEVEQLFLRVGEHRHWAPVAYELEVQNRYAAMEGALRDLDRSGFFGVGLDRFKVVINVVAPGDDGEASIIERARRLNPPESLHQLIADLSP